MIALQPNKAVMWTSAFLNGFILFQLHLKRTCEHKINSSVGLPKVFLLLQIASRKAFSCLLGCRNIAHLTVLSDLVTPSSCSCGLRASPQSSWLLGIHQKGPTALFALTSQCLLLQAFQFQGTWGRGGKRSQLFTLRQIRVQLLALPLHSTRLQTSGLSSGSLSFLICEMGMLTVPN